MSATLSEIDKENIKNFFEMDFASIKVEGVMYPVKQEYTGHKVVNPHSYKDAKTNVLRGVKEQIKKTVSEMKQKGELGTILTFLPGVAEINDVKTRLLNSSFEIATLHSKVTKEEKELAIEEEVNGIKVVLATNVARSGLTVKGVKVVISSGYSRNQQVDEVLGAEGIRTELTDFASLEQEKGRTGRTCEGTHYIIGKPIGRAYQPKKEVHTVDLGRPILSHLSSGMDLKDLVWFEEPKEEVVYAALERLKKQEFVNENCELTDLGKEVTKMPCDPLIAKLLLLSKEFKVEREVAIIAAIKESNVKINTKDLIANFDFLNDVVRYEDDVNTRFKDFCRLIDIETNLGLTDPFALGRLKRLLIYVFGEMTSIYIPYEIPMELLTLDTFVIPGTDRLIEQKQNGNQSHEYKPIVDVHVGLFYLENSILSTMNFSVDLEELEEIKTPSEAFKRIYAKVEKDYDYQKVMQEKEASQVVFGSYLYA